MKKKIEHEFTIEQALKNLIQNKNIKPKINESNLRENWENIFGKMIAQHTDNLYLSGQILTVFFKNSIVKNEMSYNIENATKLINDFFEEEVVKEIKIR